MNNINIDVIFEDNHLIAVNKKSGEIVQGDKTGDEPLSERVKKYLKVKRNIIPIPLNSVILFLLSCNLFQTSHLQ